MTWHHEEKEQATARLCGRWKFRATFVHDLTLPRSTWAIDGEVQEGHPTRERLLAIPIRTDKARIACSAPLHLEIADIIGFFPPYDPPALPFVGLAPLT